jgi:hypothetical protein
LFHRSSFINGSFISHGPLGGDGILHVISGVINPNHPIMPNMTNQSGAPKRRPR